jgi:hypothetical protein
MLCDAMGCYFMLSKSSSKSKQLAATVDSRQQESKQQTSDIRQQEGSKQQQAAASSSRQPNTTQLMPLASCSRSLFTSYPFSAPGRSRSIVAFLSSKAKAA